jgi:limonene-1,2-epoxide hydrolase
MDENERVIRNFIEAWSRLDRTRAGDKSVDLPRVGVFELEAGKIKVWRDYFDLATYQKGLA